MYTCYRRIRSAVLVRGTGDSLGWFSVYKLQPGCLEADCDVDDNAVLTSWRAWTCCSWCSRRLGSERSESARVTAPRTAPSVRRCRCRWRSWGRGWQCGRVATRQRTDQQLPTACEPLAVCRPWYDPWPLNSRLTVSHNIIISHQQLYLYSRTARLLILSYRIYRTLYGRNRR